MGDDADDADAEASFRNPTTQRTTESMPEPDVAEGGNGAGAVADAGSRKLFIASETMSL